MRRRDREVTDGAQIAAILQGGDAVNIAFSGDTPYVIPMSFGFTWEAGRLALYLHCAREGEKLTRMDGDPRVAFSVYRAGALETGDTACAYSIAYESVCGSGTLARVEGEEKRRGLAAIMAHYAPEKHFTFEERALDSVTVLRLDARAFSAKKRASGM